MPVMGTKLLCRLEHTAAAWLVGHVLASVTDTCTVPRAGLIDVLVVGCLPGVGFYVNRFIGCGGASACSSACTGEDAALQASCPDKGAWSEIA